MSWRRIFRPDCVKNPCHPSGCLRIFALQGKKSTRQSIHVEILNRLLEAMKKTGTDFLRPPSKAVSPPRHPAAWNVPHSVLLPERFSGRPPCTFGPRFRASPEPHPFPVPVPPEPAGSSGRLRVLLLRQACAIPLETSYAVIKIVSKISRLPENVKSHFGVRTRTAPAPRALPPEGPVFPLSETVLRPLRRSTRCAIRRD